MSRGRSRESYELAMVLAVQLQGLVAQVPLLCVQLSHPHLLLDQMPHPRLGNVQAFRWRSMRVRKIPSHFARWLRELLVSLLQLSSGHLVYCYGPNRLSCVCVALGVDLPVWALEMAEVAVCCFSSLFQHRVCVALGVGLLVWALEMAEVAVCCFSSPPQHAFLPLLETVLQDFLVALLHFLDPLPVPDLRLHSAPTASAKQTRARQIVTSDGNILTTSLVCR